MNSCKSFLNPNQNFLLKLFHNQVQITPTYLNSLTNKSFNYKHATQIHSKIITNNFTSISFIFNNLLNLYAKCGHFNKSPTLFTNNQHEYKDVIAYTSVITQLSKCNECYKGLIFFKKMTGSCVFA